jgi:hypothetical protein
MPTLEYNGPTWMSDLRRREVLLPAQSPKKRFLAGVDQDRQTRGALFESHDFGAFHLHGSYILG